uniref:Scaffolding protein n=1 Tax=Mycolicibacterium phage JSForest1 TaxID=3240806 RepID=A0AB39U2D5_9CAUD
MTEQHDNQTIIPEAVSDADGQTAPPEGVGTGEQENGSQAPDVNKSLKEANDRYRTERDAAREELSTAQARIERMQRAEVERLAADAGLAMGGDLFINGNAVADYLTEDGDVDAEKGSPGRAAWSAKERTRGRSVTGARWSSPESL